MNTRRHPLLVLAALALGASFGAAQGVPPAAELERFAPMVGHWEGGGQYWSSADAEPTAWTAAMHVRPTLGGHFLEEDAVVRWKSDELGDVVTHFRTVYGWDAQEGQHVAFGVSNHGPMTNPTLHWVDDSTLVEVSEVRRDGVLYAGHSVLGFGEDAWTLEKHAAVDAGAPFLSVQGAFHRVEGEHAQATDAAASEGEPGAEMKKLAPLWGTWRMEGKVVPMPGMPQMPVGATEHMTPLFGGAVVESHVQGDPSPLFTFEGLGWTVWNPGRGAYDTVWFDNMGTCVPGTGVWSGEDLVFTTAHRAYGQAFSDRSVMELGENGPVRMTTHRLMATSDPEVSFEVSYERVE